MWARQHKQQAAVPQRFSSSSHLPSPPLFSPRSVVLFPKTPEHLKTPTGEEAYNPDGLAQRSIRLLKDTFPDLEVGA